MPGNARKLARASFNIRFILFRVAGWISSEFLSSSSSLFAYRSKDRGVRDRDRRDQGSRGGASEIEQPIS